MPKYGIHNYVLVKAIEGLAKDDATLKVPSWPTAMNAAA